ncbi:Dimethylsulfonioproprionate lyase DddW [Fulvia fulva]|uniref:Dimethylsulfonioproprionate lyase DddW n=1 Tax=Passalora fulva TaxID=5499 RepID=A0A9Q8LHD5_PASFU|nr:Dimethylsulfonioproprionate lyase DddW [Fulvia fulva]KAK4624369.1 Dimethylsulfonioproprionate lyase DddW [Fulvia fulva]KAK4624795.1 Dimethylsulfonioproprionate lyase DddW [Fulvia fulva]UJO17510.1 Dimethylsulfonioproprionate lyase DddW [Fulvia fulva]WPV15465.1 Dimethylsulfonioproprionate lyase DddW [Fulvia fulva]WPV29609.1 Dimethylsulfonioproprionate lyase DddW [Fulvia fulva]
MGSIGTPAPAPRGFVLHKKQIDAMPLENFSNNSKRATGGWKQIFSSPDTPTDGLNLGIAHFPPKTATQESFEALHRHKQAEFYYILSGQALVKIDGVDHEVGPGAALFIPGDSEHGFWNTSESEELVFIWGFPCDGFRDVVYRFTGDKAEDAWSRKENAA